MKPIMYTKEPECFISRMSVVSCYIENDGKFLLLRYADSKLQGGWGLPAGKVNDNEEPLAALLREIYEETKIWLTAIDVSLMAKMFFVEPFDYIFYVFKATISKSLVNNIQISHEHQDYRWVNYHEAINLPLVFGGKEALDHCVRLLRETERNKIVPSAYLILKKDDEFLLYLRHNTGFEDGKYGLVAGHIERGESAKQALIREAAEEANITIAETDLHFAHVCSRKSGDRENIDIFFQCTKWSGEIANNEPHKCVELKFFKPSEFPPNIIKYIIDIIGLSENNIKYSEIGWTWNKHKITTTAESAMLEEA